MSDATPDPATADEPAATTAATPVVDDSQGTDEPVTLPEDDAVDPTSTDSASSSTEPDTTEPSPSAPSTDTETAGPDTVELLPDSVALSPEPVVTAASAAGTAALPDVTGGGVPDPSSSDSSTPSEPDTASSETQPSESSDTSSTLTPDAPLFEQTVSETQVDPSPSAASSSSSSDSSAPQSTQVSLGSAAENEAIVETEEPGNLSDPEPKHSYANDHHRVFKQGIAWHLAQIGWVGPEATVILEEELVPLRDLLSSIITDQGL